MLKPYQVLITEETKSYSKGKNYKMNHLGDANLKGVNKLIVLYEVLSK